ncbi:hypothetical protein OXX69_002428 [Metschnikowia pulcherrima]
MAIINNLREVRSWMDAAQPHVVPQWQIDLLLKKQRPQNSADALPPSTRAPSKTPPLSRITPSAPQNRDHLSEENLSIMLSRPSGLPATEPTLSRAQTRLDERVGTSGTFSKSDASSASRTPHITHKTAVERKSDTFAKPDVRDMLRSGSYARQTPNVSKTSAEAARSPNWANDDTLDDDLIDMELLGLPQAKRQADVVIQPAKRQRFTTSTQEFQTMDISASPVQQAPRPSAGSKFQVKSTASPIRYDCNGDKTPSMDSDVQALRSYIFACEEKINLLSKCNAVSESTSLSLDTKKIWHEQKFIPKMKIIDEKVGSLRAGFTFLNPPPTDLSDIHSDTSLMKTPSISIVSSPVKDPQVSTPYIQHNGLEKSHELTQIPSIVTGTPEDATTHAANGNYDDNIEEARRLILDRRNNPPMLPPSYEPIDDDDSEDNFGGQFMAGLQSSQADEIDTDLSGFIANEDDDAASVDVTYTGTQATQFERPIPETDEDDNISASDHEIGSIHSELDGIRLSQDVANRLGVSYEDPVRSVQVVDDFDDGDEGEGQDEDFANFTTQLNEGRDEVVEILSDIDDDALEGFNDWPEIKKEAPDSNVHVIDDSEFSDDDDEILQLTKKATGSEALPGVNKEIIAGSEAFIDEVYHVLRNTFQLPNFRSNQLEAVVSTLKGKDVFVLIPTGGGKSLCYQLPALVTKGKTRGTTVVVSPLISLMQDQIHHLKKRSIRAEMISSRGSAKEKSEALRTFAAGNLDLVYVSPEMVNKSQAIQRILAKLYENDMLARVVVDEAHCVSSWGHDFRPDYQGMSMFKEKYPRVPIMALTATANEKVRLDIVHNLRMTEPVLLKQSFNRTNLFYKVMKKPANVFEWLRDYIQQNQNRKTGIIYCHSKQSCENTSEKLEQYGIRSRFYHAGMDADERFKVQSEWQENKVQVICATIAFGMGIDKPDVRFVIHNYIPKTLEGYYQETGRAGRDGKSSECIMFYAYKDARALKSLIERDKELEYTSRDMHLAKLRQVVQYCENGTDCRRRQVLHYFNEIFDSALCRKMCDNCCSEIVSISRDVTEHCSQIVKLVQQIHTDKVTVIHCQDVYWGSKSQKIVTMGHASNPYHGAGRDLNKGDMERIFFFLQCENALMEYQIVKGGYATSYVKLGPNANKFMKGKEKIELSFAQPKAPSSSAGPKLTATGNGSGLANFRYQDSFVSAREVRNQEDSEREGMRIEKAPSRIVLQHDTFGGEINDSNREHIEKAYTELRNFRTLKSQELGYGRAAAFINDRLMKELASKLPTNARDFAKLDSVTKEQHDHFIHFKKILATLARDRKKATTGIDGLTQKPVGGSGRPNTQVSSSPYFHQTQTKKQTKTKTTKAWTPQKSSARGNKSGKKHSPSKRQSSQKPHRISNKSTSTKHIRQMPI